MFLDGLCTYAESKMHSPGFADMYVLHSYLYLNFQISCPLTGLSSQTWMENEFRSFKYSPTKANGTLSQIASSSSASFNKSVAVSWVFTIELLDVLCIFVPQCSQGQCLYAFNCDGKAVVWLIQHQRICYVFLTLCVHVHTVMHVTLF